jgi:hypothetical protein
MSLPGLSLDERTCHPQMQLHVRGQLKTIFGIPGDRGDLIGLLAPIRPSVALLYEMSCVQPSTPGTDQDGCSLHAAERRLIILFDNYYHRGLSVPYVDHIVS